MRAGPAALRPSTTLRSAQDEAIFFMPSSLFLTLSVSKGAPTNKQRFCAGCDFDHDVSGGNQP